MSRGANRHSVAEGGLFDREDQIKCGKSENGLYWWDSSIPLTSPLVIHLEGYLSGEARVWIVIGGSGAPEPLMIPHFVVLSSTGSR